MNKKDTKLTAPCGLYCGDCELLGDKCTGCQQVKGKPFWAVQYKVDVCPLYGCCVDRKKLEHCGLCAEFPCETFTSMRDPSMSDEEAAKSLDTKKNDLRVRKQIGTRAWLDERP
jgi:hypothetical protein